MLTTLKGFRRLPLLLCLLLALMSVSCSGGPFASKDQEFTAQFRDSLGLYEGNNVTVLGYPVGKISDITTRGTHVDVTFTVDAEVAVPADVRAVILRPGIVTDRALELTPAFQRGGKQLASGSVIPLSATRQPLEYDQVLTALDEFLVALSPTKGRHAARDATKAAAGLLGGNGRRIRDALAGLSSASDIALHAAPDIQALLRDLDVLVRAVARHDDMITGFSGNLAEVTSMLAEDSETLTTALSTTAQTLERVSTFVSDNRALIQRNVTQATRTSRTMAGYLRELQEILVEFPLALENIGNAIDPRLNGLKSQVAWGGTINGSGLFQQACHGSVVPFLCALTELSGIPGNFTEKP